MAAEQVIDREQFQAQEEYETFQYCQESTERERETEIETVRQGETETERKIGTERERQKERGRETLFSERIAKKVKLNAKSGNKEIGIKLINTS